MTYERRFHIEPGFYLIRPETSRNYGIGDCRIFFYVIGEKGAVQWMIGTDWYPAPAREHLRGFPSREAVQPVAWDIGYHSRTPMYDGHTLMGNECNVIGGPCYYDGSSLNAEKWVEGFINGGTEWLWPKLEEYYRFTFDGAEHPDMTPQPRKHPDDIKARKEPEA
jgi:hypothetical protein